MVEEIPQEEESSTLIADNTPKTAKMTDAQVQVQAELPVAPVAVENDTVTESNSEMPVDQVTDLETNAEDEDKVVPETDIVKDNTTETEKENLNTIIEPKPTTVLNIDKATVPETHDNDNANVEAEETQPQAATEPSDCSKSSLSLTTTTILVSLTAGAFVIGVRSPFVSVCMLYGVINYAKYTLL
ncbi:hypothetical protein HRR83_000999 [Exophiala dermatitidis]|nr:hypothetical protein HRR74_001003 [Exophiala dermatitidis]KAJ4527245.1 hypothetical protein HRR73_002042 [Exophiala dermatitidis]KAJ4532972.1 hypothetical protein HRR76_007943 [Exophiala dermatitidis]KAJ4538757.1 hypothetical protein HRR77_006688 [Exophiala dermatitidis]KAJ4574121.1 hypothetical protein HRR79_003116 [Exophiala dermatitidis]